MIRIFMIYSSFMGIKPKYYYPQNKSFKLPLPKDRLYYVLCDGWFQLTSTVEPQKRIPFTCSSDSFVSCIHESSYFKPTPSYDTDNSSYDGVV